ncbi:hypothetical protein [Sorangium sp. So ce590]
MELEADLGVSEPRRGQELSGAGDPLDRAVFHLAHGLVDPGRSFQRS